MAAFLLRRLFMLLLTLLAVSVVAFSLIRLVPGDPVLLLLGERGSSPEVYAEMRHSLGLDQPLLTQYQVFITKALQGDLGKSIVSKRPVLQEFWDRFPATLELGFVGLLFAVLVGVPVGVLAAVRRNSFFDYFFVGTSMVGYSMPIFWWGLLLILVFSVTFGWTPVSGRISLLHDVPPVTGFLLLDVFFSEGSWEAFKSALSHLILPSIALGTIPLAVLSRMTRSSLLEVLGEDYIRTAKAKGLSNTKVIWIHAFRNALIPIVTTFGLLLGSLVTGAILTETIFSWPGIGKWLVASVTSRDYPVIQGGILLIAASVVLINLTVDIVYAWINPRLRHLV